jgi:hypothetical protein
MHFLMSCSKYDKTMQDLFSSFHVVILQRDTKGWYSRKCSIIKRRLLLVSSAEEQDEIEMSERKKLNVPRCISMYLSIYGVLSLLKICIDWLVCRGPVWLNELGSWIT